MIIFGTRGKVTSGDELMTEVCPDCGHSLHRTFGITRYVHVFWIPVFPYRRRAGLVCSHCQLSRVGKDLPPRVDEAIRPRLFGLPRLLPYFTGLFLLAALVAWWNWDDARTLERHLALINDPRVGDIYEVDSSEIFREADQEFRYLLLKVVKRDGEAVELVPGSMGYSSFMGSSSAIENRETERGQYFLAERIPVDIRTLREWREQDGIFDVHRPAAD